MFDIKITHPLYDAYLQAWQTMRDAVQGEDDVKARGHLERKQDMKRRGIPSPEVADARTGLCLSRRQSLGGSGGPLRPDALGSPCTG